MAALLRVLVSVSANEMPFQVLSRISILTIRTNNRCVDCVPVRSPSAIMATLLIPPYVGSSLTRKPPVVRFWLNGAFKEQWQDVLLN